MYDRLIKVIKEAMPDADFAEAKPDSRLVEDLGFDSVALMMLAMSLEDEFNVKFNEQTKFVTVKDVLDYIERNGK